MLALRKFVSEGKIILRAALSEVLADEMRSLARHGNFIWTSDLISGLLEDDSRVEAAIPDQQARNLTVILRIFFKTFSRKPKRRTGNLSRLGLETRTASLDASLRRINHR
ncbi:hypothetical protein PHYPSEUDO_009579 [Phytophthora pseudosyringae]|uniref:Uncharacterized protein n=1 Tax=Phytophthora pseudosyringae TaxID=221518 RepID=A0A8T1WJG2_9STRA|nr:hypothetical protein PHYPSEUDO_009579 [Phytophthora pseudosyringae]